MDFVLHPAKTMRHRVVLAIAVCRFVFWVDSVAPGAEDDAPQSVQSADDDSTQNLIICTPTRPLLVRLTIRVDGRPFREVWQAYVHKLLGQFDKDSDGLLTLAEALKLREQLPTTSASVSSESANKLSAELGIADTSKLAEKDVMRLLGVWAPPLQLSEGLANSSRAAGPAMFPLLDANRDGRLSAEELSNAARRLRARDFNDDGLITSQELILDLKPATAEAAIVGDALAASPAASLSAGVVLAFRGQLSPAHQVRLLSHYDTSDDGRASLAPAEVLLPAEHLSQLDKNADGHLTEQELARLATCEPDLELQFDFGRAKSSTRGRPTTTEDFQVRRKIDGGYKIIAPGAEIAFDRNNRDPAQGSASDLRFSNYDADANAYLDADEAKTLTLGAEGFAAMDADRDGKIFRGEFDEYTNRQNTAAAKCLLLQVFDQGQDLFSMFDANGDGVLSPRELARAAGLATTADRDGDGVLSGHEIPQRLTLELGRGLTPRESGRMMTPARQPAATKTAAVGPEWFRKMDRNADGDLSKSEFLGPLSAFAKLDTSGDGLIDLAEAAAGTK